MGGPIVPRRGQSMSLPQAPQRQAESLVEAGSAPVCEVIGLEKHALCGPFNAGLRRPRRCRAVPGDPAGGGVEPRRAWACLIFSGSFGSPASTIASAHSPWQRMASARQFASRIAKSLDQKGVIMRSFIRMAQPVLLFEQR